MTLRLFRPMACLLAVLGICAPAGAQTLFDIGMSPDRHVYELRVGGGRHHAQYPAAVGRGFHYPNSASLIYLVNVFPGVYSLGLSFPAGDINYKPAVSLFDRWPYDSAARRYDLPMGPMAPAGGRKIEYLWSLGISPASTSTLLYIAVEVPGTAGAHPFPHEIYITAPQSPLYTMERGITFLSGPSDLVLESDRGAVAYVVDTSAFDPDALPPLPIPGDLVENGSFRDGLNHWTPCRERAPAEKVESFALKERTLQIKGTEKDVREGVMQKMSVDVSKTAALILRADVMVVEQTQGGLGPAGRNAPIAIAVGYKDASGKDGLFWKGFYSLAPDDPAQNKDGQKVPKGKWYRCLFDLMQLDPKPAEVLFIALEGSGWPVREGWVREVHLIKSGDTQGGKK